MFITKIRMQTAVSASVMYHGKIHTNMKIMSKAQIIKPIIIHYSFTLSNTFFHSSGVRPVIITIAAENAKKTAIIRFSC